MHDGNDVDKIFLIVTSSIGGHLELSPVGELDLDLFRFPFLVKIRRKNIRDGRPNGLPYNTRHKDRKCTESGNRVP